MNRAFHVVALALAALSSACSSAYSVSKEEFLLRLLPQDDALLILEVQCGISDDGGRAVSAFEALLHGAKRFPPEQGFVSFDLDRQMDDTWSQVERSDFREFAANVHVEAARLFRDDRGQLCFVRRTRIDHLDRTLEITNAYLNRQISKDQADHAGDALEFQPTFPTYDEATRDAVRSAAASGQAWITVRGGALVLDYPMSELNAGRCLNALANGEVDRDSAQILTEVSSLQITDARVLLRFGEPHKPVIRFASDPKKVKPEAIVDEQLMTEVRRAGVTLGDAAGMNRMRAEFESGGASTPTSK